MKTACEVIRDLLPLYQEHLLSQASVQLVEEHLGECEDCRRQLELVGAEIPVPEPEEEPLRTIRKGLRRSRRTTAGLIACLVAVCLFSVFSVLSAPRVCSDTADLYQVVDCYDGETLVIFDSAVTGYRVTEFDDPETGVHWAEVVGWSTLLDRFEKTGTQCYLIPENVDLVYYHDAVANGDGENTLVWSRTGTDEIHGFSLPRLYLAYWGIMALGLAVILGVLWLILRKKESPARVLSILWGIPLSFILGLLCIKGIRTSSLFPIRDLIWILLVTAAWYGAYLCAKFLWRSQRRTA